MACYKYTPHLFFYGKIGDWLFENSSIVSHVDRFSSEFSKYFVGALQIAYNEKDCFMCTNKVPEEGIVIRKERLIGCESYKLKSFRFLEWETKQLDNNESNIEDEN